MVGAGRDAYEENAAYFRVSVPVGIQAQIDFHPDDNSDITVSPDGHYGIVDYSFVEDKGQIINIADGVVQNLKFERYVYFPNVWSPDSKYLTVAVMPPDCRCRNHNYDLGIVDVETGDLQVLTDGEFFAINYGSVAWSADGSQLAYLSEHYDQSLHQEITTVRVIAADGSQPPRSLFSRMSEYGLNTPNLRWSPDGKRISLITWIDDNISYIWMLDAQTGRVEFQYASSRNFDICWSQIDDHFVLASDTQFTLMTPQGTKPLDASFVDPSVWALHPGSTLPCAWSPDGTKLSLIYYQGEPTPVAVKLIDFTARQVTDIQVDDDVSLLYPIWSPDSQLLAITTYNLGRAPNDFFIYDMDTMQPIMSRKRMQFIAWLSVPS